MDRWKHVKSWGVSNTRHPTLNEYVSSEKLHVYLFIQEPITRSLHLPYKPSESTLSDEKLFIETVFGQNLPRPNA